jgi:hypothetical protein
MQKPRAFRLCTVKPGRRKHELAEEYLANTQITEGLFLILVGRAQAPVWDIKANHHIEPKRPMPYGASLSGHLPARKADSGPNDFVGHPWTNGRCTVMESSQPLHAALFVPFSVAVDVAFKAG